MAEGGGKSDSQILAGTTEWVMDRIHGAENTAPGPGSGTKMMSQVGHVEVEVLLYGHPWRREGADPLPDTVLSPNGILCHSLLTALPNSEGLLHSADTPTAGNVPKRHCLD